MWRLYQNMKIEMASQNMIEVIFTPKKKKIVWYFSVSIVLQKPPQLPPAPHSKL